MAENDHTASSRQLTANWSTATGSSSRQTIDGCVCNGLISTEPGNLIGTKLAFQINHASFCGTMVTAFVLDAILVNTAFQSALSNDIGDQHPELWLGVRFRIMDNPICYELRVILVATSTSTLMKCYSPKVFPFFKAFLGLSLHLSLHAHRLQRPFETSVKPSSLA
ncbi:HTH_Tnp_Tc3_2 domain-containing protein [Trichonephila clavipes]|nr:HTH_Tnp_Tc3_2 domain-containing protein [Trichonephila clavipes]